MRITCVAIVVLCININVTFGKLQHPLDEDMECFCVNKANRRMSIQMKITNSPGTCMEDREYRPIDCKDAFDNGHRLNGVYDIYPEGYIHGYKVYCDMTTDGGGWTVLQKRFDGSVDFYRTYKEYRNGFGTPNGEYWLGNEKIHQLTAGSNQVLRIDMMDDSGTWKYATYKNFSLSGNDTGYKLSIGTYKGNAGDAMTEHNQHEFQTKDKAGKHRCAITYNGAWWYTNCHNSNLNGKYGDTRYGKGLNWKQWLGYYVSLVKTEMKIRRGK